MINTSHITYDMVCGYLYDYIDGRREFDDPYMNKLMQDEELFQEFLNHFQSFLRFKESGYESHFMFNLKFIHFIKTDSKNQREPSLSEKIEFDAEYNKIIALLASFTKEDIKTHTVVLLYMIELAVKYNLLKLLDIILTYVDLKTLKRDFVIADYLRLTMMLSFRDKNRREEFLEVLKVFLNHGIDIVEFFDNSFIFNVLPECHQELMDAGYDYSEYMSTKYLNTSEVETTIRLGSFRHLFALKKEHKQVIIDEFLSSVS